MKAKTPKSTATDRATRAVRLAEDACPSCGSVMRESRGSLEFVVNGERIRVPHCAHLACPKCNETVLRMGDARRLSEDAIAIYRKKHRLLSADEIRRIREHFGLTQSAMAKLLRLGANTISRWESGRNAQTASMDVLLKLIRDVPGSIEYLQHHAA